MTGEAGPARIRSAEFVRGVMEPRWIPEDPLPIVLAAGRSNAGKSSLLNAICGRTKLARVSKTPGRTTEINFFRIDDAWFIADLPGYGYARRGRGERARWEPVIMALLDDARTRTILLAVDIRRDPEEEESQLARLALENDIFFRIIMTKADKLGRNERRQRAEIWKKFTGIALPSPIATSVKTGEGIAAVWEALMEDVS